MTRRRPRPLARLLALTLVLALAAPPAVVARTMGVACRRCPPACPMHRKAKPGCHHGASTPEAPAGCAFRAPGCDRDERVFLGLPLAVIPARSIASVLAATRARLAPPARLAGRLPDAPDTPPPIVSS